MAEKLEKISTGVPNLDWILKGGIPKYSVNIIAGSAARSQGRGVGGVGGPKPAGYPRDVGDAGAVGLRAAL